MISRFVQATVTHYNAKGKLTCTVDCECEVVQDCGNYKIVAIRYCNDALRWNWFDAEDGAFQVAVAGIDPLWIEQCIQDQREEAA